MSLKHRRFAIEEFVRRGSEVFEQEVEDGLTLEDERKYVAIDIETGACEIDADEMAAGDRLLARIPDSQMWMERVVYSFIHRFSYRIKRVPV